MAMCGSRLVDPLRRRIAGRLLPVLGSCLVLVHLACAPGAQGSGTPPASATGDGGGAPAAGGDMAEAATWKDVDRLVEAQKFEAASAKVLEILRRRARRGTSRSGRGR